MRRKSLSALAAASVAIGVAAAPGQRALAGGNLETLDFTDAPAGPGSDDLRVVEVIDQRWDERCIPVPFRLNGTQDPIADPNGPAFLSLDDAEAAIQAAFDTWNGVPTSFIEMNVVDRVANPGFAGLDSINEVTFNFNPAFGDSLGISVSTVLLADAVLADGMDLDGDRDGDVSNRIATCRDVDGDGDVELAAGEYRAGTILENDVSLNASDSGITFTVGRADIDADPARVDLRAVATHEFGHSHGLSHGVTNQIGRRDGTEATMWPFIDQADPASEAGARSLHTDDAAYSSLYYPEPPTTTAAGAVGFDDAFGRVTGEVRHGALDEPIAGATVFAVNVATGRRAASAFSGTARCLALPLEPARLFAQPPACALVFTDPAAGVLDGTYVLPLPAGRYKIGVEAIDGTPTTAERYNETTVLGELYGQQSFPEEFFDAREAATELNPAAAATVEVVAGEVVAGVDIVTNVTRPIASFGGAIEGVDATPGLIAAVRIPAARLLRELAVRRGRAPTTPMLVHGATFLTAFGPALASTNVPVYARAMITTGAVDPVTGRARIDLDDPLVEVAPFVGQDFDFTPLFSSEPRHLGGRIQAGLAAGTMGDLFLVLQNPTTGPVGPGIPFSMTVPVPGRAFVSTTGGDPFIPIDASLPFTLELSQSPAPGRAGVGAVAAASSAGRSP